VAAETVYLKNGDQITGTACSVRGGKVFLTTDYARTVEINLGSVQGIDFDRPVPLILDDGTEKKITKLTLGQPDFRKIKEVNPPIPQEWSFSASAGYQFQEGNSNTGDVNARATIVRFVKDEYRLTADGSYVWGTKKKDSGAKERTANRGAASLQADLFWFRDIYCYFRSEIGYDRKQDLERRLENGPGFGYELFRVNGTFLDLEMGASYIDSKYNTDIDKDRKDHGTYLRIAESGELALTSILTLMHSASYKPKLKGFDDYFLDGSIGLRFSLSSNLYLTATFSDRYNNRPASGKKKNDIYIVSSLGVNF